MFSIKLSMLSMHCQAIQANDVPVDCVRYLIARNLFIHTFLNRVLLIRRHTKMTAYVMIIDVVM